MFVHMQIAFVFALAITAAAAFPYQEGDQRCACAKSAKSAKPSASSRPSRDPTRLAILRQTRCTSRWRESVRFDGTKIADFRPSRSLEEHFSRD